MAMEVEIMEVEILIDGLAICYIKNNIWNVAFICDSDHKIDFEADGAAHAQSPIYRAGRTRSISFNLGNTTVSPPAQGIAFDTIFNMAASYAHGPGKLNVEPSGTTNKILMTIPSASLGGKERTENKYFVQNANIPGDPPFIIDSVAKIISAKFQVTDPAGFVMTVTDDGTPINIPFPFREGPFILKLDNDCKGLGCSGNDFALLYDWVQDSDGKKFYAGQVRSDSPIFFSEPKSIENFSLEMLPFSPLQGNCDPVDIFPPPGPPGDSSATYSRKT